MEGFNVFFDKKKPRPPQTPQKSKSRSGSSRTARIQSKSHDRAKHKQMQLVCSKNTNQMRLSRDSVLEPSPPKTTQLQPYDPHSPIQSHDMTREEYYYESVSQNQENQSAVYRDPPYSHSQYRHLKIIGESYPYNGVYLGFNKSLQNRNQFVICEDYDKIRIFWLLRGIKQAKKESEAVLVNLENYQERELSHQKVSAVQFENRRKKALRDMDFYYQKQHDWPIMTESEIFRTTDHTQWKLNFYPNGRNNHNPRVPTFTVQLVSTIDEDFWIRKLDIEIGIYSYNKFVDRVKKILTFSPEQEEQDIVFKMHQTHFNSYLHSGQFFYDSHIFSVYIKVLPYTTQEWNAALASSRLVQADPEMEEVY